jgi:uncharacterized membrane protein
MIPAGFLKAWAATAAFILVIDAIWLGFIARGSQKTLDALAGFSTAAASASYWMFSSEVA